MLPVLRRAEASSCLSVWHRGAVPTGRVMVRICNAAMNGELFWRAVTVTAPAIIDRLLVR